jgi:hypothetical protein
MSKLTRRETIASKIIKEYRDKGYEHQFTITGMWNGKGLNMHTGSMLFTELESRDLTTGRDLNPGVLVIRGAKIKHPFLTQLIVFKKL